MVKVNKPFLEEIADCVSHSGNVADFATKLDDILKNGGKGYPQSFMAGDMLTNDHIHSLAFVDPQTHEKISLSFERTARSNGSYSHFYVNLNIQQASILVPLAGDFEAYARTLGQSDFKHPGKNASTSQVLHIPTQVIGLYKYHRETKYNGIQQATVITSRQDLEQLFKYRELRSLQDYFDTIQWMMSKMEDLKYAKHLKIKPQSEKWVMEEYFMPATPIPTYVRASDGLFTFAMCANSDISELGIYFSDGKITVKITGNINRMEKTVGAQTETFLESYHDAEPTTENFSTVFLEMSKLVECYTTQAIKKEFLASENQPSNISFENFALLMCDALSSDAKILGIESVAIVDKLPEPPNRDPDIYFNYPLLEMYKKKIAQQKLMDLNTYIGILLTNVDSVKNRTLFIEKNLQNYFQNAGLHGFLTDGYIKNAAKTIMESNTYVQLSLVFQLVQQYADEQNKEKLQEQFRNVNLLTDDT